MKRISKEEFQEIIEKHPKPKKEEFQKIVEKHPKPKKEEFQKIVEKHPKPKKKEFQEIAEKHPKPNYPPPIQQQIIDILKKKGSMSRDDICEEFGYKKRKFTQIQYYPNKTQRKVKNIREMEQYEKRTTIFDNLIKLEKKGIVERFGLNNGERGRSVKMWKLELDKCKKCMHRINDYCKAYKFPIESLNTDNCERRKVD